MPSKPTIPCTCERCGGTYWHSLPKQQAADARKDAALKAAGWTVLRFSEEEINTDSAGCAARVALLL